jgi:hypothetical protein
MPCNLRKINRIHSSPSRLKLRKKDNGALEHNRSTMEVLLHAFQTSILEGGETSHPSGLYIKMCEKLPLLYSHLTG